MTIEALGDSAVVVALGSGIDESALARVRALADVILGARAPAILDVVPAFSTVAVFYDPVQFAGYAGQPFENVCRFIRDCAQAVISVDERGHARDSGVASPIDIPVCYGGDFGPDLAGLAAHSGLTPEEVQLRHCGADYVVHAIGFVPGFPYLAGLPAELAMARRSTPRMSVAAGSVGIGGAQTGVYPLATPGGWQIVGRSPIGFFSTERTPPSLLRAGDHVKFRAVSREEFDRLQEGGPSVAKLGEDSTSGGPAPCICVIRPGMLTTVQDLGRVGHRASGVPLGGAMDSAALRTANLRVGNPGGRAALEITLLGPELEFLQETLVAVEGAEFEGIKSGEGILMRAGDRLKFGRCLRGCRAYLAFAGGVDVPAVLGSRSTYLRGGFGGFHGRSLRAGDRLAAGQAIQVVQEKGSGLRPFPTLSGEGRDLTPSALQSTLPATLRAIRGSHGDEFGDSLFGADFKVSQHSDRMGLRLSGPELRRRAGRELVSGAVAPGTVQIPPDGQPIVLAADAQTIGGYPRAAHVISADLRVLGQLKPGDTVRFREVALGDAHAELLAAGKP